MRAKSWIAGLVATLAIGLTAAYLTRDRAANDAPPSEATAASLPAVERSSAASTAPVAQAVAPGARTVGSAERPLERDPRKPGYSAARIYGIRMDGAREIFEAEPRDPVWAKQRETDVADAALNELKQVDPEVKMEVECRTGTCRVRVHSRIPYLTDQMAFYPLVCLAAFAQPEWGNSTTVDPSAEDPFSDFYLIFGDSNQDSKGFTAWKAGTCPQYRDDWLRKAPKR